MANKKHYYINLEGKKTEYILEKSLSLSQKMSFVVEVAGTVVSKEVGYAYILQKAMFNYCLVRYYTNIVLFEDDTAFSLDKVERFLAKNKENVLDVIQNNIPQNEYEELQFACDEAIEYRKLHYNDLKDEIEDLLQVVRAFVLKPDRLNELLEALTDVVTKFANREDIDLDAVNKLVNIIPVMQDMDNKEVAKAIIKEFHRKDEISEVTSKPYRKNNKGRKNKESDKKKEPVFTVETGEKPDKE